VDITVPCGTERLAAWLYSPAEDTRRTPIVVMAHGLGGVKELGLDAFARRFVAAGYRALVFDYRGFGGSTGSPRQVVSRRRQLEDWDAAVRFATQLPGVDPQRVAAWGSSFAGGLVIDVIRRNPQLAAAVGQCPFTDGLASARVGNPVTMVRLGVHGVIDLVGALLRRPPHLVPVAAAPWRLGFLTTQDSPQYFRLVPDDLDFNRSIAARFAFSVLTQRPGRRLGRSAVPLLLCVAERDLEAPAKATLKHAEGTATYVRTYPFGHFEIYVDAGFEAVVADQVAFFAEHLG
jgi:uncharacterized protein